MSVPASDEGSARRAREAAGRRPGTSPERPPSERTTAGGDESGRARTTSPWASRVVLAPEERALLVASMSDLAEEHRTVLRLVHQQGLKLADAAAAMGAPPETVRMLYGRAVAALVEHAARRQRATRSMSSSAPGRTGPRPPAGDPGTPRSAPPRFC
jgi:DNA-directed RNA polymerase specialized sigma24 family protein